ncbi:MAG: transketolase [Actinomycetota bacterium]|nr:transketolase [Actinomycetota bacterium]
MSVATDPATLDELCVNSIRTLSMDAVQQANSGHPGTPMALAPLAYVLYARVMKHSPTEPAWPNRDRFVLSAGHASMLLYASLHLSGYDMPLEELKNFRQLDSKTPGHPEYNHAPGIETTTGPLGQGISTAVGMALAERMLAARFNRDGHEIVDYRTYSIVSDGDLQEGIASEASSLAGHLGLGRLIAFYDDNHISIDGTELSFSEDVGKRYEAYGWHVIQMGEDLALDSLARALAEAGDVEDRPSLIIVRTHIAPGSPNKQDTESAHGSPLGEDEVRLTKEAYEWPSREPFWLPEEAVEHFRSQTVERGREQAAEWHERLEAYRREQPEAAAELERITLKRTAPEGWDAEPPTRTPDEGSVATRKAGSEVLQWVASRVPELVGGAADLATSTLTVVKDSTSVARGEYAGRNIHFGIREHGMGAIVNGLTVTGLRGYGSTFLIFSDYMKHAIRLSALMRIPSTWVFTHDSIGVGEDGPTHEPIEQLPALRSIPNLDVVRPADFNETVLAWRHAVNSTETPVALALTRQGLPTLDPASVPEDGVTRGAYVLRDAPGGDPDLILIGTGSEVHVALAAVEALEAEGRRVRVVSMPCMDRFTTQDQAYRDSVLPPAVRARVAVEAASPFGWHRWVGEAGEIQAMEGYGASAPGAQLFEHFGFTGEKVAEKARRSFERAQAGS